MKNRVVRSVPSSASLEQRLRELCCWYEWSEPPNMAAADVLQGAADALKHGELSAGAARLVLKAWHPSVGVEARAGNAPELVAVATTAEGLQRGILSHMRSLTARATTTEKRLHLMALLEEQARIFGSGVDRD
jgi:hypothetical protein